MKERLHILLRLPFLLALTLLILNDHWLKEAYPSWLSGKLSDFSGLFVLAVFLFVILGRHVRTSRELQILHLLIAAIFTVWKLAPVEVLTGWLGNAIGIPMPSRVKDVTDLAALVMLPLSYKWLGHSLQRTRIVLRPPFARKALMTMVLLIAGWSIMATSYAYISHNVSPETGIATSLEPADVLAVVEKTMNENGFPVYQRETTDSNSYRFFFTWTTEAVVVGKGKSRGPFFFPGPGTPSQPTFMGTLVLSQDTSAGTWTIDAILSSHGVRYDEAKLAEVIRELLWLPLRKQLDE